MPKQQKKSTVTFLDIEKLCLSGQLKQASEMFKTGAIKLLSGPKIVQKIDEALEAESYLQQGLEAEKNGDIASASGFYKQVLALLPEHVGAKLHLAIIAIQQTSWQEGLEYLKNINGDIALYLRGCIYYKLGHLKKVHREWDSIRQPWFEDEKKVLQELLKTEVIRQKKLIQTALGEKRFADAKFLSERFLDLIEDDALIRYNLQEYIIPKLEQIIWEEESLEQQLTYARDVWVKYPSMKTLHNYAISSYYFAQNLEVLPENFNFLIEALGATFSLLANLDKDPSLREFPWLENDTSDPVNHEFLTTQLKADLEAIIEQYKSNYPEIHLRLKDYFILEEISLEFITNSSQGTKLDNLYITPTLFKLYKQNLSFSIKYEPNVVWTYLYTDLGRAVASCLKNNINRAIEIKYNFEGEIEPKFVEDFLIYYEGCFCLEKNDWREAKSLLQRLKPITNSDWIAHLDSLMVKQLGDISNDAEEEEFTNFWYDLIKTKNSCQAFVDCKYRKIAGELRRSDKNEEALNKFLSSLQKLLEIDPGNSRVISAIEKIKVLLEVRRFYDLVFQGQIETSIDMARASRHQEVRFEAAKFFIDFAIMELNKSNPNLILVRDIVAYAYSIAPNEPAFQNIYRSVIWG